MTGRTAQPVDQKARPGSGEQVCLHCGGAIFYSVSVATGSRWLHSDTFFARCPKLPKVSTQDRDSGRQSSDVLL
jgi:hypothetical protein